MDKIREISAGELAVGDRILAPFGVFVVRGIQIRDGFLFLDLGGSEEVKFFTQHSLMLVEDAN